VLDRLRAQLEGADADVHHSFQQILGRDVVARAEAVRHVEPDPHAGPLRQLRWRLPDRRRGEVASQQGADGGGARQGDPSELASRE
jgi:hypothetical protein